MKAVDNPDNRNSVFGQCGLCGAFLPTSPPVTVQGRAFYHCPDCDLLQMAITDRLNRKDEADRYLKHENNIRTQGYTTFLERLIIPVLAELERKDKSSGNARGLDFGSGPYPMLAELMAERGFPVEIYDPLFAPRDKAWLLAQPFDYVLCCETAEHFYRPFDEFALMTKLITTGGFIGIMTSLRRAGSAITSWHYAQDETHVALYSEKTMHWIARRFGLQLRCPAPGIIFLMQ